MQLRAYQTRGLASLQAARDFGHKAIVLQAVTGAGKTLMMVHLIQKEVSRGGTVAVYTNRRLLLLQLAKVFDFCGISHGFRAAGFRPSSKKAVQLCMVQTERSRSLDSEELHAATLVVVDEAHLNANGATEAILRWHLQASATLVGFTATPVELGHLYTHLIQACNTDEARRSGALLKADCRTISIPHRDWVRKVAVSCDKTAPSVKKKFVQAIVGRVADHWLEKNPGRLPTLLFAPDVPSSLWLAKDLTKRGIRAGHIDAKGGWFDGQTVSGSGKERLIQQVRHGDIEILCNRFILREAIDIPEVYCGILACKFGSETSFLQSVGRILRFDASLPDHVLVLDHGGNFYEWGSPNENRYWELGDTSESRAYERREKRREEIISDPIVCPQCHATRSVGNKCHVCGYVADGKTNMVLQLDGRLTPYRGRLYSKHVTAPVGEKFEKEWLGTVASARKKGWSFIKAFATFGYRCKMKYGRYYKPDPSFTLYPKHLADHKRQVSAVSSDRLNKSDQARGYAQAKEHEKRGRLFD